MSDEDKDKIVINDNSDSSPPELTYFSFSPDTVNLNRNPVEFIFEGTDDLSGFNSIRMYIYTEDHTNYRYVSNSYTGETQVSDSLYITFEENDPEGLWLVEYIKLEEEN